MKYYSIIILFFSASCGYGQYPNTRYKGNEPNIYEHDSILPTDRILDLSREDVQFENFNQGFVYVGIGQNPDTVYFYWKKYLFYSHQSDKQKDIIKKQRNPSYKEYDRLMDSVVRYKKLIDGLKQ